MMKSESFLTCLDSNATEMFKDQKSSKGIVKIAGRYGLRKKSCKSDLRFKSILSPPISNQSADDKEIAQN